MMTIDFTFITSPEATFDEFERRVPRDWHISFSDQRETMFFVNDIDASSYMRLHDAAKYADPSTDDPGEASLRQLDSFPAHLAQVHYFDGESKADARARALIAAVADSVDVWVQFNHEPVIYPGRVFAKRFRGDWGMPGIQIGNK